MPEKPANGYLKKKCVTGYLGKETTLRNKRKPESSKGLYPHHFFPLRFILFLKDPYLYNIVGFFMPL